MFRLARNTIAKFPGLSAVAAVRSVLHLSQTRVGQALVVGGATIATVTFASDRLSASAPDYAKVRAAIESILDDDSHDDGSYGPIFVRLAWHASGTFDKNTQTGGSGTGASMRFGSESKWGANAGLQKARDRLEIVKKQFPGISYADLWTLAGAVAIESMGGPVIPWRPGRVDCMETTVPKLPDGLLPDASQGPQHLRDIFYRMGLDDREIVALSGAHTLGRCHPTSSGYVNPWTNAPTTFSNLYFQDLLSKKWKPKKWKGKHQYEDPTGTLMMLPADLSLLADKEFHKFVELYAKDEKVFFDDFAKAFSKLMELGVKFPEPKPWYKLW
eukprot:c10006_g1_i2.p1 GENE.c10006_g1_i2~~c10006_g1_i2.p1  ORF type:complete len:329 (-),score=79.28 c10006_g1_i2:110-1096(-)